jgi:nitrogen fixation protein NifU and related proteins
MYSDKVMEHFKHPKNVGELKGKNVGVGKVGNPRCGDQLWFYIKIEKEVIVDVKFKSLGCAANIATSSVLTELVKGKSIEEALKVSGKDIIEVLEGLPQIKQHCSLLAIEALKKAIEDYKK